MLHPPPDLSAPLPSSALPFLSCPSAFVLYAQGWSDLSVGPPEQLDTTGGRKVTLSTLGTHRSQPGAPNLDLVHLVERDRKWQWEGTPSCCGWLWLPESPLKVSGALMGLDWIRAPVTRATPAVRGIVSGWDWHSRVAAEWNESPIPSCLSPHHTARTRNSSPGPESLVTVSVPGTLAGRLAPPVIDVAIIARALGSPEGAAAHSNHPVYAPAEANSPCDR